MKFKNLFSRRKRKLKEENFSKIDLKEEDFPKGSEFHIKEFNVPLVYIPNQGWFNWFGGKARPYDVKGLKPGNNWPAENFSEWLGVVEESKR